MSLVIPLLAGPIWAWNDGFKFVILVFALLVGAGICMFSWMIFVSAFWILKVLFWNICNMLLGARGDSSLDDVSNTFYGGLRLFTRGSDLAYLACGGSLASVYASSAGPLKQTLLRFVLWHQGGWYRPAHGEDVEYGFATLYVDYLIGQMHEAKELSTPVFHNEDPFGGTERRKQQPQNTIPSSRKFDLWRRKAPTPTVMEFTMSGALQPGGHTDLRESGAEENLSLSSPPPPAGRYRSLFTSRLFRPVRRRLSPQWGDYLESLVDVPPGTDSIPLERHTGLWESGDGENRTLLPLVKRYQNLFIWRWFRPARPRLPPQRADYLESLADITPNTDSIPLEHIPLEHQLNAI